MSVTTANIKGSNIKRLVIEQLGSNLSSATLTQPLIEDAESEKYDVQIEDFWIRSDVPIIETDTTVFSIFDRGVVDQETPVPGDEIETCVVGPVYNWMDLCSQIAKFLTIFSNGGVFVGIETHYMMQKKISFVGNLLFWQNYYIQLTPKFAEIFDKKREEGLVENVYLLYQTSDAAGAPVPGPLFKPNPPPLDDVDDSPYLFNLPQTVAFPPNIVTAIVRLHSRMELFENRHRIRIDCTLPLPHEVFGIGEKNVSAKMSNRYTFMEFDWPQEIISCETKTQGSRIVNRYSVEQKVNSGNMQILRPGLHSGLKKMLVGQTQAHRYELFIVRKVIDDKGKVTQKETPWPMKDGDWFRLSLLFVKET